MTPSCVLSAVLPERLAVPDVPEEMLSMLSRSLLLSGQECLLEQMKFPMSPIPFHSVRDRKAAPLALKIHAGVSTCGRRLYFGLGIKSQASGTCCPPKKPIYSIQAHLCALGLSTATEKLSSFKPFSDLRRKDTRLQLHLEGYPIGHAFSVRFLAVILDSMLLG